MQHGDFIAPNREMDNYLMRLATFHNMPDWAELSSMKAAKAGFYYTGPGDSVACYSCGLRLNHWQSGVQPMTVHRQLSTECQFVVAQTTNNASTEEVVTGTSRTSPEGDNHHQRRRRGYNSRYNYYTQLAAIAGSRHVSSGTNTDRTSDVTSPINSSHVYRNVDRFTSRRMMERINNNDPTLVEEMKYERRRLSSYTNWPRDTNIAPEALAQAGLFYLCRADRVKCAFCGGILRNWGPSEEPMRRHRHLFPTCPFLRDPQTAGNVALGDEPTAEQLMNITTTTTSNGGTGELGIETALPRHPAMAVEAVRLASFDRWPRSSPVTPETLARAGFYYTDIPGDVCCFFCGGHLNRWQENDDPMTRHRHLYPTCCFVRLMADTQIDPTVSSQSLEQLSSETASTTTATTVATTASSAAAAAETIPEQRISASSQSPTLTCKVCLDASVNIVFLPCGHLACCANCAIALSTCPICRSAIKGRVRTYLA